MLLPEAYIKVLNSIDNVTVLINIFISERIFHILLLTKK